MGGEERLRLSIEEEMVLLDLLFSQQYAFELVSCELSDIENGDKKVNIAEYRRLIHLYEKLSK